MDTNKKSGLTSFDDAFNDDKSKSDEELNTTTLTEKTNDEGVLIKKVLLGETPAESETESFEDVAFDETPNNEINNVIDKEPETIETKDDNIQKDVIIEKPPEEGKEDPPKKNNWLSKKKSISASKKTLVPGLLLSTILILIAQFVDNELLVSLLFNEYELKTLPNFLSNNMGMIIKVSMYLIAAISIYLSFKAKSQGKLFINNTYILYKKNMFKKTKILLPEIVSVDIHFSPFSILQNVGHLEISSVKGDINLKNCPYPDEVKEYIIEKRHNFTELK